MLQFSTLNPGYCNINVTHLMGARPGSTLNVMSNKTACIKNDD